MSEIESGGAPWYFKQRAAIIGGLYGISFVIGFPLAASLGIAPVALAKTPGFAVLAAALVLAGYALRVWASSYLAATIVWTQDVQLGALQVDGPYRFVRNPLYVGNFLQAIGVGMFGPWPVLVLVAGTNLAYSFVLISVEERYLAAKNGAPYLAYLAAVPSFVPIPGRSVAGSGAAGSPSAGIRSEAVIAVVTVAILIEIGWLATR